MCVKRNRHSAEEVKRVLHVAVVDSHYARLGGFFPLKFHMLWHRVRLPAVIVLMFFGEGGLILNLDRSLTLSVQSSVRMKLSVMSKTVRFGFVDVPRSGTRSWFAASKMLALVLDFLIVTTTIHPTTYLTAALLRFLFPYRPMHSKPYTTCKRNRCACIR